MQLAPRQRGQSALDPLAPARAGQSRVEADALDVVALLDRLHDVETVRDLAEHRMPAVEMRLRFQHEEELRAAGVAAGMGHRQRTGLVLVRISVGLAGDAPAGPPGAVAVGAAALGD